MEEEAKKELNCLKKLIDMKLVHNSNLSAKELISFNEDENLIECIKRKLIKVDPIQRGENTTYNYSLTQKGEITLSLISGAFQRISR